MKTIYELMDENRLITILRGIPSDMLCDVLDALYDGGIRLAEITYDYSAAISEDETAAMIEKAVKYTAGRMYIGAGTVTRQSQLDRTAAVGGRFIISPNTDTDIIRATKKAGLISIPGAMTVSEICDAMKAGADYVKLFPVGVLGIPFIKQVLAPINTAKLLAVGGVDFDRIPDFIEAGCVGFGIGGAIANKKLCEEGKLDVIRENAEKYAAACRR